MLLLFILKNLIDSFKNTAFSDVKKRRNKTICEREIQFLFLFYIFSQLSLKMKNNFFVLKMGNNMFFLFSENKVLSLYVPLL